MTVIMLDSGAKLEIKEYKLYYFKIKQEENRSTTKTRIDSIIGMDGNSLSEVLRNEQTRDLRIYMDLDTISQGSISFEAIWGEMDGYTDETPMDYPVFIMPIIYEFKEMYLYQNSRIFTLRQKKFEEKRIRKILSEPSCIQWESVPTVIYSFATLIRHFCRPEFITIKRIRPLELGESETDRDVTTERAVLTELKEIIEKLMYEISSNTSQLFSPFLISAEEVLKHFLTMIDIWQTLVSYNYDLEFENLQRILNNFVDILNNIIATLWLVSYSFSTFTFGEYAMSVVLLQKSLEGLFKSFGRLVLFLIKPDVSSENTGENLKDLGFFESRDDYKSFEKLEKLIKIYKFFGVIESHLLDSLENVMKEARNRKKKSRMLTDLRNKLVHFPNEKWLTPILLRTGDGRILTVEGIIDNLNPLFELLLELVELALQFLKDWTVQEADEHEEAEAVVSELESVIKELRIFMPREVANKLRFLKELYLNLLLLSLLDFKEIEVIR